MYKRQDGSGTSPWIAQFLPSLLVILREGMEAILVVAAVLALIGGAIELAQSTFFIDRTGEWIDWQIDLFAITIGLVVVRLWRGRKEQGTPTGESR